MTVLQNILQPVLRPVLNPVFGGVVAIAYDLKALFTAANQTFTDAQVLDTAAEGVETGSLTVVDTSTGTVKIVSNELEITGDATAYDNTGVYGNDAITKELGKAFLFTVNNGITNVIGRIGTHTSSSLSAVPGIAFVAIANNIALQVSGSPLALPGVSLLASTDYEMLMLSGGYDTNGIAFKTEDTVNDFLYGYTFFIRGGIYSTWTMIWADPKNNTSTGYVNSNLHSTNPGLYNNVLIPTEVLDVDIMFQPNFLDTFTGTNGDSLVNAHTPEVVDGATGTGNPYTSVGDTWDIQSNAAVNSGYVGAANTEFFGYDTGKEDGIFDVSLIMSDTASGRNLCADSGTAPANNLISRYDFANGKAELIKVVGGLPTSLISVVAAYSAGATLRTIIDKVGTDLKVKLYYNGVLIGTEQTISDAGIVDNTIQGGYSISAVNSLDTSTNFNRTDATWDTEISSATGSIY